VVAAVRYAERLQSGGEFADEVEVGLGEQPTEVPRETLGALVGGLDSLPDLFCRRYAHGDNRSTVGSEKNYLLRD
jgi:hypothetical protein